MSLPNLRDTENIFKALEIEIQTFYSNLKAWEDMLPVDDQGDTIFPEVNEVGGAYSPERVNETLKALNNISSMSKLPLLILKGLRICQHSLI